MDLFISTRRHLIPGNPKMEMFNQSWSLTDINVLLVNHRTGKTPACTRRRCDTSTCQRGGASIHAADSSCQNIVATSLLIYSPSEHCKHEFMGLWDYGSLEDKAGDSLGRGYKVIDRSLPIPEEDQLGGHWIATAFASDKRCESCIHNSRRNLLIPNFPTCALICALNERGDGGDGTCSLLGPWSGLKTL